MSVVVHGYISARDRQSRIAGRSPKLVAVGRALAHVKYIQHRPGEDREQGGRTFFDELDDRLDGRTLRKAIRELEDSRVVVHKLTLAPEIEPLDKREYTREVMHRLAAEKGQDLRWMAVVHENTAHHHIHVVVLGEDKNGRSVRIDRDDYSQLRDWGDRYLERWQPRELQRSRDERKRKERERVEARKKERELMRQERINEGLELPWMHKKIIREQYEPYSTWKDKQQEKDQDRNLEKSRDREPEKPYFNDTIQAAGKEWSRENTLSELNELNTYLWDNYDERIPLPEYKKLVAWIKEKERLQERARNKDEAASQPTETAEKQPDHFEFQGDRYDKKSPYEKLTALAKRLRDDHSERLPVDDYQKLRCWIENADRAHWAEVTERQPEVAKRRIDEESAARTSPDAGRYVNPLQQQMMSNPVVGLFMPGASIANELVRWVDLRDNRDLLKESRDRLEDAKNNRHQEYVKPERTHDQKARDQQSIEDIDKSIYENQETRNRLREEREMKRRRRDRGLDFMR